MNKLVYNGLEIPFISASISAAIDTAFWQASISFAEKNKIPSGAEFSIAIGNETFNLIAETNSSSDDSFDYSLGAVGKTALLAEPYSEKISQTWTNSTASTIAAELCTAANITLNWTVLDWFIDEYTADNVYPIEVIEELASEIGAKVQSTPDGELNVIAYPSVRPDDLQLQAAGYSLSTARNVFSRSERQISYDRCDWILVTTDNATSQQPSVTIESEDDADDKICRVRSNPFIDDLELLHKSGADLSLIYEGVFDEQVTESIIVENKTGNLSKEFFELVSYEYIKDSAGAINIDESGNITTELDALALLSVTYKTRYHQYRAQRASGDVKAALVYVDDLEPIADGISVECVYNAKTKQKDAAIVKTSNAKPVLLARGKAELWPQVYDGIEYSLEVAFDGDAILPGGIAELEIVRESLIVNCYVKSVSIEIGNTIVQNLTLERPVV